MRLQILTQLFRDAGAKFAEQSITMQSSAGPQPAPKPKTPSVPDSGPSRSSVLSQASTMTANTPNVRLGGGSTLPFTR